MSEDLIKVAVVGARGYVGFELLKLLDNHPKTQVVAAFSRAFVNVPVHSIVEGFSDTTLCYQADELDTLSDLQLDVIFLALPNELAKKHNKLWQQLSKNTCVIDLSSDFRFDKQWAYGQPETCKEQIIGQSLIANPGCYATAAQLALLPIVEQIKNTANIFGVSGYSGAGSKPCDNNNPEKLANNLKAYKLQGHIHEKEISHVLGKSVHFMPHVAEFFRGIHLTISVDLNNDISSKEIELYYQHFYQDSELIQITAKIPEVQQVQNTHKVIIGGFNSQNKHLVMCASIDNLLKGAATQAIQNMNLALGLEMNLAIA